MNIEEPRFHALVDIREKACTVKRLKWRSPAWQKRNLKIDKHPALRLFVVGQATTFLKAASEEAFWDLPLDFLQRLAALCPLFDPPNTDDLALYLYEFILYNLRRGENETVSRFF